MTKTTKKFNTEKNYFDDIEYISSSMLNAWIKCPHFFQSKYIDKTYVEPEREYFVFGKAVDTLITEPEAYKSRFITVERTVDVSSEEVMRRELMEVQNEIVERNKEEKPVKALENKLTSLTEKIAQLAEVKDKEQLTPAIDRDVQECVIELRRQPLFKKFGFLEKGTTQEMIALEIDGFKVKGKIDFLNLERKILADLKTTANIETFNPKMYLSQMAWYQWLVEKQHGIKCQVFIPAVDKKIENKRSAIYLISDSLLEATMTENMTMLGHLTEQRKSGFFTPIEGIHNDRFACPDYKNCPFALQKEVIYIS